MIWPADRGRADTWPYAQVGFTLIEIVIVLAVLGLIAGLIVYRGPPRSPLLDLRAAGGDVARILRLARSQAIMSNRPVVVVFDMSRREFAVGGSAPRALPAALGLSVIGGAAAGARQVSIRFAPDGSSSGGHIDLAEGERREQIGVDWLTGRVQITPP